MDVRRLLLDDLSSIYFGPGLDNGTPVRDFGEEMKLVIDEWVEATVNELSKYPDVYGSVV